MNHIGIDVSHKELVVVISVKGKARPAKAYENTVAGHKAIIRKCLKLKGESRVCLEATGIYHFDLAVAISRTQKLDIMVINPKISYNFSKVLMKRSKTDQVDAEVLAIYCEKMLFVTWYRPADEVMGLRAISRRIAALSKLKTQTKNQHHALSSTQETPDLVIDTTDKLI